VKDGRNGGAATARKHAILIEGQLLTKRAIARHIGVSDSTIRSRIKRVFEDGRRLTLEALSR
jgi:transposase